jgi:hypothetical protein
MSNKKLTKYQKDIQIVLNRAKRLEKLTPPWIYMVEKINRKQYEKQRTSRSNAKRDI